MRHETWRSVKYFRETKIEQIEEKVLQSPFINSVQTEFQSCVVCTTSNLAPPP